MVKDMKQLVNCFNVHHNRKDVSVQDIEVRDRAIMVMCFIVLYVVDDFKNITGFEMADAFVWVCTKELGFNSQLKLSNDLAKKGHFRESTIPETFHNLWKTDRGLKHEWQRLLRSKAAMYPLTSSPGGNKRRASPSTFYLYEKENGCRSRRLVKTVSIFLFIIMNGICIHI